jgi:hypothetical protein
MEFPFARTIQPLAMDGYQKVIAQREVASPSGIAIGGTRSRGAIRSTENRGGLGSYGSGLLWLRR